MVNLIKVICIVFSNSLVAYLFSGSCNGLKMKKYTFRILESFLERWIVLGMCVCGGGGGGRVHVCWGKMHVWGVGGDACVWGEGGWWMCVCWGGGGLCVCSALGNVFDFKPVLSKHLCPNSVTTSFVE